LRLDPNPPPLTTALRSLLKAYAADGIATVDEIAKWSGIIDQAQLAHVMKGESDVTLATAKAIAAALGLKLVEGDPTA
jgi:hypothetical protein